VKSKFRLLAFGAFCLLAVAAGAQQPAKPVDISPNDGEIYYLVNQHSGLQADSSGTGEGEAMSWIFKLRRLCSNCPH